MWLVGAVNMELVLIISQIHIYVSHLNCTL